MGLKSFLKSLFNKKEKKKPSHYRNAYGRISPNSSGYSESDISGFGWTPLEYSGGDYHDITSNDSNDSGEGLFGGGGAGGSWGNSNNSYDSYDSNDGSSDGGDGGGGD